MKSSRPRSSWFARTLLLVPAIVIGCTGEPLDTGPSRDVDEGRVKLGSTSLEQRNFDARVGYNAKARFADSLVTPKLYGRFAMSDIAATFHEETGATRTLQSRIGVLTERRSGSPQAIAL